VWVIRAFSPRVRRARPALRAAAQAAHKKPPWPPTAKGWPGVGQGTFMFFKRLTGVFVNFVVVLSKERREDRDSSF